MSFGIAQHVISLDGRPHIGSNIRLWGGDSVGHWDGNTLVVDTTNMNEYAWYDQRGNFHSNDLHLTERWTIVDANTIELTLTNSDPKVFNKPWSVKYTYSRAKNAKTRVESAEDSCYGGPLAEFERQHRAEKFGQYEIDPPLKAK